MGCQSEVTLGANLTFSICTHDADTGALTDADAAPAYRIYEDDTDALMAGMSGTMAVIDNANTTGFYVKKVACTTANGFEVGKSYTVYIEATVDGTTGGISYGFRVMASIPDSVWDTVLLTGVHDTVATAGNRLRKTGYISKAEGVCGVTTAQTTTLDVNASATANIYCQDLLLIIYGTGIGQARLIMNYTAGKIATVDRPWDVLPVAGASYYQVIAFNGLLFADTGTAQSATASTSVLATSALNLTNSYVGCSIHISSGTGAGQTRLITGYAIGRTATVKPDWETTPDATSAYKVIPVGRSIVDSISDNAITDAAIAAGAMAPKKNTALANFEFLMVDSTDHVTPKTGLAPACQRSIDGNPFANCATAVATEVANGIYKINLAATDLNGDVITLKFTAATADATYVTVVTQ